MQQRTDKEALVEAEELYKKNRWQLEHQRRLIMGLDRTGGDVTEALAVLEELLRIQELQEGRLTYLRTLCDE
jgi:hypothetical protein